MTVYIRRSHTTFLVVTGLAILLMTPIKAGEAPSHYAVVQAALDKSVLPNFDAVSKHAAVLNDAVAAVCLSGTSADKQNLKVAFRDTVLAWAGVEYLRFGPLADGGRRERMSFWPDPRGIMNRQLRQLIASSDATVVDGGAIAKQSAAVQGLPALEFLLVDEELSLGPELGSAFRCKLASAIGSNIKNLAQQLQEDWIKPDGWKDKMLRPGSDNAFYKEPQEAASELVKALLVGIQIVADSELKPRLDLKTAENFKGPFARSGLSKDYFHAGVTSLDGLYSAMGLESYLADDKTWLKNWLGGAWRVLKTSDGNGGVWRASNNEPPTAQKVFDMANGIKKLVGGELSTAAGLTVGFNELDGD